MPLESLITGEPNIRSLAFETPERREDVPFDASRDLTKEDWQGFENALQAELEAGCQPNLNAVNALYLLGCMRVLGKTQELDDSSWKTLIRNASSFEADSQEDYFGHKFRVFESLQFLGKESALTRPHVFLLWNALDEGRKTKDWPKILNADYCLMRAEGHILATSMEEDEQQLHSKYIAQCEERGYWTLIAAAAARMNMLGRPKPISRMHWKIFRNELQELRASARIFPSDWKYLATFAADLQIAASESVKVTSEGITVRMPLKTHDTTHVAPLPDLRKFSSSLPL